ncbi:hypothetical protein AB0895_34910 [Streptomyces globisporus]|uniref:hypothetical protein n=1 Tax=Streptomyces globisporus TaxID=1908 RepID=UPI0034616131
MDARRESCLRRTTAQPFDTLLTRLRWIRATAGARPVNVTDVYYHVRCDAASPSNDHRRWLEESDEPLLQQHVQDTRLLMAVLRFCEDESAELIFL